MARALLRLRKRCSVNRKNLDGNGGVHCTPPFGIPVVGAMATLLWLAVATDLLSQPGAVHAATAAIILLGLPHGAYDLQILAPTMARPRHDGSRPVFDWRLPIVYVMLLAAAVVVWAIAPAAALTIFLVMAAAHFGEDWTMIGPGLLRHMSGMSIIAAITFASPHEVANLFGLLSSPGFGVALMQAVVMTAPMVLLVNGAAMITAIRQGQWRWSLAHALALVVASTTPPIVGFAAYFVIIHSSIHLKAARDALTGRTVAQFALQGLVVSAFCLTIMLAVDPRASLPADSRLPVLVLQLLAVLTVPHLLLTHRLLPGIERLLPGSSNETRACCARPPVRR